MRTPKPRSDESLMGFILRLTEKNGYDTPAWILQLGGLSHSQSKKYTFVLGPPDNLERLSRLTGVGLPELATLFHPPTGSPDPSRDILFFGLPVPKFYISAGSSKVCPDCLRESAYRRKVWDLAAVTVCPTHSVMLLDECPRCSRPIRWTRKSVCGCPCDFDFREAEATPVSGPESSLTKHIHRLCGLLTSEDAGETANNPLLALSLKDVLSAVIFIAGQYQNTFSITGKDIAPNGRNTEIHSLLTRAFSVFENWPQKYFEFLAWRQCYGGEERPGIELHQAGARKEFGTFYKGIRYFLAARQFDFLRFAFGEYLSRHWEGGYLGGLDREKMLPPDLEERKYVTAWEAANRLNVSLRFVERLAEAGKLKVLVTDRYKRRMLLVEVESLTRLRHELDCSLGLNEVAGLLGITSESLNGLIDRGLVKALRGPTVDGCLFWRFGENAVDELFDKIRARMPESAGPLVGDELSFNKTRYRIPGRKVADLLTAIIRGEISPCGETSDAGLSRFVFKRDVVVAYTEKLRYGDCGKAA